MDRELEVRTATYGPGIDQSQHAKSVSHIIILLIFQLYQVDNRVRSNKYLCEANCPVALIQVISAPSILLLSVP